MDLRLTPEIQDHNVTVVILTFETSQTGPPRDALADKSQWTNRPARLSEAHLSC